MAPLFLPRQNPSGLLVSVEVGSPDYYRGSQGEDYQEPPRRGFATLPVLEFLCGSPWDDFALCWLQALRPSKIRVTRGEETTDAIPWRVTVQVNADNRIESIYQEVEVGLRKKDRYGHDLQAELDRREVQREEVVR